MEVLVGSGKQVRHIKIATVADLEKPCLKEYICAAIAPKAGGLRKAAEGVPVAQVRGNYPVKRRPSTKNG